MSEQPAPQPPPDEMGASASALRPASEVSLGSRPSAPKESWPWLPLLVATAVIAVAVGLVFVISGLPGSGAHGAGDAYVSRLSVSGVQMSQSESLGGAEETYLDGTITNRGDKVATAVMVKVLFRNFSGGVAARDTLPITLIRSRQPYVIVEPVSASPINARQSRQFRVAFDSVPDSWNQAYPQVSVVSARVK